MGKGRLDDRVVRTGAGPGFAFGWHDETRCERLQLSTNDQSVVVFGGTGHYGRHIVHSLLERGARVDLFTRDVDRARELLVAPGGGLRRQTPHAIRFVEGDVTDQKRVHQLIGNHRHPRVVLALSAFAPRQVCRLWDIEYRASVRILEEVARRKGRAVLVSAYEPREQLIDRLGFEAGRVKLELERRLREMDFDWTILGAAFSMALFFRMIRGTRMVVPGGGRRRIPVIACEDVGQVAAQAVLRDDLAGRRLRLAGPHPYSFPEATAAIGSACSCTVRHVRVPLLPLRVAATLSRPFSPFLAHLYPAIRLFNGFPDDLAASAEQDCRRLCRLFDLDPTPLEAKARAWCRGT